MLAEICLTPSIFDEAAHPDPQAWVDQIRELGSSMFPRVAACPVMISNLFGGSWHNTALQTARRITNKRARLLCEGMLKKAADTLVNRPACLDWPGDDDELWGREAIHSHGIESIDRIVMASASHAVLCKECSSVRSIDEVEGAGFWSGISADCSPPMHIAQQVALLRKVCVHSEFLCLITPHIYGGGDDETDFAVALIRSALDRPLGYANVEIEVHAEAPGREPREDDGQFVARLKNKADAIERPLRKSIPAGRQITLYLWPKLRERLLIAGLNARGGQGVVRAPRWGIYMGHIARKPDAKRVDDRAEWKILQKDSLIHWFGTYCQRAPGSHLYACQIRR